MSTVSLRDIRKDYDGLEVLHGIDLEIGDGEFVVLVGPSGCGKSTTLRMIAGLEDITSGDIAIGDRIVNNLAPKERNIAMVFQNYAIYPHMSVYQNIGFGLYSAKMEKSAKDQKIREAAKILDLTDYLDRRPANLSGGQRQRVAIGRAMVRDPAVFLFDEPLSNLDAQLRAQMRLEIKKLHQSMGTTIIFVTHDQVEAMTLADRIVIMKDGDIQQVATPDQAYQTPANMFVAQFIGTPSMNMLPGTVSGKGKVTLDTHGDANVPTTGDTVNGQGVHLGVRPDALAVTAKPKASDFKLTGTVSVVEPLGPEVLCYVDVNGTELIATGSNKNPPAVGDTVTIAAPLEELHLFDTETELAIR
ncbi:MAG: ABC transporter ATP-binding protein [Paracoccaceae bacterium]